MTKAIKNLPVPHPGQYLLDELNARGWSQRDLAFVVGAPEQGLNLIISEKRGISPEMAKLLGDAFDQSPEYWMNLQRMHDLYEAPQPDPDISRRARLQQRFPVREMIKRGWLTQDEDQESLEGQLANFFCVQTHEDIPYLRHHAKKTHYEDTPPAQLAWLFRVRQIAKTQVVAEYSESKLRQALREKLAGLLSAPEETRHVAKLLAECGVRFVVVEALPGSKIDGVCFWLDAKSPIIGMSIQRDRIDNFWFVLRHEIEHVLRKDGLNRECIDEDVEGSSAATDLPASEKAANRAAADFCVPQAELIDFMARVQPYFSEHRITMFADSLSIHPGLIIGQLQRRLNRWDFLKKLQVKVRAFVTSSAVFDGWGLVYPIETQR